jgi:acyl carrier protein
MNGNKVTLIRLQKTFRDIFDDDEMVINAGTNRKELKEWDSVAHVKLILTIENEFDIRFIIDEITNIKSVNDFIEIIQKKAGY